MAQLFWHNEFPVALHYWLQSWKQSLFGISCYGVKGCQLVPLLWGVWTAGWRSLQGSKYYFRRTSCPSLGEGASVQQGFLASSPSFPSSKLPGGRRWFPHSEAGEELLLERLVVEPSSRLLGLVPHVLYAEIKGWGTRGGRPVLTANQAGSYGGWRKRPGHPGRSCWGLGSPRPGSPRIGGGTRPAGRCGGPTSERRKRRGNLCPGKRHGRSGEQPGLGAPPGRANGRRRGRAFELVRLPARCLGGEAELRRSPLGFTGGSPLPSYPRGAPPSSPAQQHRRTLLRPVPSPPMIIPAQRVPLSHPPSRGRARTEAREESPCGRLAILGRSLVRSVPSRSLSRDFHIQKPQGNCSTTTLTAGSDLCGSRVLRQRTFDLIHR